jgi:hypothetical protein
MLLGIFVSILFGLVVLTAQANLAIIQPQDSSLYRFSCTDVCNINLQLQASGNINTYTIANISSFGKPIANFNRAGILLAEGMQSLNSMTLVQSLALAVMNHVFHAISLMVRFNYSL